MKAHVTILTACLLSAVLANGQTTNSSTTGSSTSGTTSPTSTTNTYSTTPSSASSSYGSGSGTTSGSLNSTGTSTSGSTSTAPTTYGTTTTSTDNTTTRPEREKRRLLDYKNFVFGLYAGLNTTRFAGESSSATNGNGDLSGRLGYQAGFFVRGGGRLYGQLGAEYFASSSNYFTAGSGQSARNIQDQINIQYVQIPVYIGYKLVESDRGISAVRVQLGLEYANQINSDIGDFSVSNAEIKSGTFNGLGQLGFDAGPILLDLTYHYGFSDSIQGTGFAGSARRILSASIGFKF